MGNANAGGVELVTAFGDADGKLKRQLEMSKNYDVMYDLNKQAGEERKYDSSAKNFFKKKVVMMRIVKYFVPEFSGIPLDEVQNYFVDSGAGDTNVNVNVCNTVSEPVGEKEVDFDLKFRLRNPKAAGKFITLDLVIDFETQNKHNPGYSLKKRGVYYCARMLNEQLLPATKDNDYDTLNKVYSIWVITDSPKKTLNTVQIMTLKDQDGNIDPESDLIALCFINMNVSCEYNPDLSEGLKFLYSIFAEDDTKIRGYFSEHEYNQIREEIISMSKPHEALKSAYLEKGRVEGIIKFGRSLSLGDEVIIAGIMKETVCSYDEACKILREYDEQACLV